MIVLYLATATLGLVGTLRPLLIHGNSPSVRARRMTSLRILGRLA